jgi:hypothetical protein
MEVPMKHTRWLPRSIALGLMLGSVAQAPATTGDPILINEILASHTGTDDTEYVELFGTPGTPLNGLSLIIVEGDAGASAGTIDRRIDFRPFQRIGPNGAFLIGNCAGLAENYGVIPDKSIGSNFLENSSFTAAIVRTDSLQGGVVAGAEVALDGVALKDPNADANGDRFFFDAPVLGPDGSFFPAGVRRLVDGTDTDSAADWVFADFFLGPENTPVGGGLNGCEPLALSIPEIQGSGARSPVEGEIVRTRGVVTLLTRDGRSFWIQDPEGDGDPATSDAVLVFRGGDVTPVEIGDHVTIEARVSEFVRFSRPSDLPLTELDSVAEVVINATGHPLPEPIVLERLPAVSIPEAIEFWEALEGMRVRIENAPVVAPTSRFGEFAVLARKNARPGSGYFPQTSQILLRPLGENEVDYNPERILIDDESIEAVSIQVRPGDRVRELTGVVDYSFGNYKLQPAEYEIKTHALPQGRISTRSGPKGGLSVTTFNVENLFDLTDNPDKDDQGSTPSPEALQTKLAKLALAIENELLLPAILVVQEVENTEILQTLGDRINAATGTDYRATSFETSDGRGIEVGFLHDAARVSLREAFQLSDDIVPGVSEAFGPDSASPGREPLVGMFEIPAAGPKGRARELTIIGNHFKSKGGDDPLFGTNQPAERETELQRKLQAGVVRDYANTVLDADPSAWLIVTGDLNDFQFGEPGEGPDHPLAMLEGGPGEVPLINLVYREKRAERYSFVFDGNSQVLDHTLISPAMRRAAVGVDFLHFNAGFPSLLSEDPSTPIRSADHDPLELRLRIR